MSENKIRNAHCTYFEGQTGLCKAKEFVKCNPVNCKLYTIDELSTILDLQEQLKHKEQECEKLKTQILSLQTMEIEELEKLKQEKAEIKKYLGISDKSIMQRLEELQEFKDELKISEDRYKQEC